MVPPAATLPPLAQPLSRVILETQDARMDRPAAPPPQIPQSVEGQQAASSMGATPAHNMPLQGGPATADTQVDDKGGQGQ
eukprot:9727789-Prorocentrum_lima.AAC.1